MNESASQRIGELGGRGTANGGLRKRIAHRALLITTLALLALPALQPLLSNWFTCGYDNSFHLWRAVEVHHLLRQGVLYPRWAADMAHGYGFPLFNFVSPLSAYAVAGLRFAGLPWTQAVNLTFALGILLSGLTTYLFVRDHFGQRAGLVAAVAYVYAPFQAYDVFNRGSLSQAFAWWLPPLLLWSLGRWQGRLQAQPGRRGDVAALLIAALSMAALILTHNLLAFLFSPLIIGLLLLLQSTPGQEDKGFTPANLAWGALPLVLGLGLTAFFWLPGLAERGWVQTQRLLGVWVFDYRHNFLGLGDLLALPRVTDPALVNDWPPRALGLVPALIACLPLLGWRRFTRPQRWLVALLLAGMVGFGLMTLPVSRLLWDRLPLLNYVQFPWRFLGPAAFCAAVLAGAVVSTVRHADGAGLALIAVIFLANQGWFFPDHCPPPDDITVAGMIRWEQATDTLGATAGGEYLPVWVRQMPGHPQLLADYASGGPIRRLETEALPPGVQILRADYGPLGAEIELDTPQAFQARYLAFYYPGWQARIDGQPVELTPSDPHGLITFAVPAGHHVIHVRFGSTPLRAAATILSVSALGALLFTIALIGVRQRHRSLHPRISEFPNLRIYESTRPQGVPIYLLLALTLIAARFLIAQDHTPLRRTRLADGQLQGVDHAYDVDFGHRWILLGHDRLPVQIAGGEALQVVLYWRAHDAQGRDYAAALALADASGQRWTQVGLRAPRWHRQPPPVYAWPVAGYALTAYLADLLPGTPPGDYRLVLTAFDKADPLMPLTAYTSAGVALGPSLDLGTIRVERPSRAPDAAEVPMQTRLGASLGPLTLAGVNLDRDEAAPGDPLLVTLFWQARGEALVPEAERSGRRGARGEGQGPDLRAHLALVDAESVEVMAWELPPVRADWPTSLWQPGDLWRGQHLLRLPGALESGSYTWRLQLYEPASQRRYPEEVDLGHLTINAPQRLWQAPPLQRVLEVELGQQAALLGANLEPASAVSTALRPPATVTVTLAWQARAEMTTSYRVFLHLLGPDGSLLTQSDGEPANWTRPTTGWAPGEVVLDERVLALPADAPAGQYALVAGLYDPDTRERLPLPDGTTAVHVVNIVVQPE